MKRAILLIAIAMLTFLLYALYKNPGVLENIWLWLIGLGGLIIQSARNLLNYIKDLIGRGDKSDDSDKSKKEEEKPDTPRGDINLSLLRYVNDGETTTGQLYINGQFFCYTLEDPEKDNNNQGEVRILAGFYSIGFRKEEDLSTQKYAERYPEWFTYHLELQGEKVKDRVYIRSGGDNIQAPGSILVSGSLSLGNTGQLLTASREAYRSLYQYLAVALEQNKKIIIHIQDETWFQNLAS